jgi:hypothetical protein
MYIFIDESGTFTGYHDRSISVVAAPGYPQRNLRGIQRKYTRIRPSLPKENGEVKGRGMEARDVNRIVRILANRQAILEVTAIDLSLHTQAGILAYKDKLAKDNRTELANFPEPLRSKVAAAVDFLDDLTPQLFIQALTTFELIHRVICRSILYFAQRRPYELSSFTWVIDGKEPAKVTRWEDWLAFYAPGALIALSNSEPVPMPEPGCRYLFDYSFLGPFRRRETADDSSLDPARLLKDLRFEAGQEMGVEFVDVLENATRRLLRGDLDRDGWTNMHKLMIHRPESYIKFILFRDGPNLVQGANYGAIVNEGFVKNGKRMFTLRNEGFDSAVGPAP